jgi:hypothetical protein
VFDHQAGMVEVAEQWFALMRDGGQHVEPARLGEAPTAQSVGFG